MDLFTGDFDLFLFTGDFILFAGDLELANRPIDILAPENMDKMAGHTDDEIWSFDRLISEVGLVDLYRWFQPNGREYTWWLKDVNRRPKSNGWRIDYFLASCGVAHKSTS